MNMAAPSTETLFTNVRILDGTGQIPYAGSVRVRGNRIVAVGRSAGGVSAGDALVVDAAGATLMPGMTEAHTHFSWNDAASLAGIQTMPLEEHVLWTAKVAHNYLKAGFTSCLGAACAKPRLDVVPVTWRPARRSPCPVVWATRCCRTCRFRSSASAWWSTARKTCARSRACS
jgi:imidazolonepropionase-like amidohydrolase